MASECPLKHPEEWPVVRLADITLKIGSGATPHGGAENYLPERTGFALIRSQNVFDRYFDYSGLAFISDAQASELQNANVQSGDLLLNITGDGVTFSRCCVVPEDVRPACVNQHVSIVRVDPSLADPGYVLDFLTHPIVKGYIESFNAGGSRRAITKGHIESFKLPLPPITEQRSIANILKALDDKIELNRKMNETLEAMARALFKSWFVGFDPVRAKAEGRNTGLLEAIAALFPDSFEEIELGNKPQGWANGTFDEVAENLRITMRVDDIPADTPYIGLDHMPRRSIALSEWGKSDGLASGKAAFHAKNILFGKLRPYFHKVGIAPVDGVCSTDIVVIAPKEPNWFGFVLQHASSDAFVSYTNSGSTGTKMPRTSWVEMARYPLVLPPVQLVQEFNRMVAPMYDQIIASIHGSRTLSALRDALLPKLISGEIRLNQMEERA